MPDFTPGLVLSRAYYDEVVRALVEPVPHAAARLGWGSDVLGYDTERSTDHGWGPRVQVFVDDRSVADVSARVDAGLPQTFHGWPTRYGWDAVEPRHWVEITTLSEWLHSHFGYDPRPQPDTIGWLITPQQLLLGVTSGAVFHDPAGELAALRAALCWFPDDVWRYLLMCQWLKISQEEPFPGRTAQVGDAIGSRVLSARLARELMRLAFLVERTYAPYSKWFGTAFAQLDVAPLLAGPLERMIASPTFEARERGYVTVVEELARRFNGLGITESLDPATRPFYDRPFQVLGADRFVAACRATITDPVLRRLAPIGSVDQHSDSTDVVCNLGLLQRYRTLYESP